MDKVRAREEKWKEEILHRFYYKKGEILYRDRPECPQFNPKYAHKPVGYESQGYKRCVQQCKDLGKRTFMIHRIVWLLNTGNWPKDTIDHIDKNPLNNEFENLRDVTQAVNNANRGPYNKGGKFKGVYQVGGKWLAEIHHNKAYHRLGLFNCLFQAVKAYDKACVELKGVRAKPNLNYTLD